MSVYGVTSDRHFHSWSAFSKTLSDGMNSRLALQIEEFRRLCEEVLARGGDTIIDAGDSFHVRGRVAPSVLNPVLDLHREMIARGLKIIIIAGNHDAEHKDVNRLGSAITSLENVGCTVVNSPTLLGDVVLIPWFDKLDELRGYLSSLDEHLLSGADRRHLDLFLHAPLNGVIRGLPDTGLTPEELAVLGFRNVFCGHYHNHVGFPGNVWSIGALGHHTWSDVGSRAGFLVVDEYSGAVEWRKSHMPDFIELNEEMDEESILLVAPGNYVKAKINSTKSADVEAMRKFLLDAGAAGVVISAQKEAATSRDASTGAVEAGASLEVSVGRFVASKSYKHEAAIAALCESILVEAGA